GHQRPGGHHPPGRQSRPISEERPERWAVASNPFRPAINGVGPTVRRYGPVAQPGRSIAPEGWRRGSYSVTPGPLVLEFQPLREQNKNPRSQGGATPRIEAVRSQQSG